jgi:hypothetical protein
MFLLTSRYARVSMCLKKWVFESLNTNVHPIVQSATDFHTLDISNSSFLLNTWTIAGAEKSYQLQYVCTRTVLYLYD